MEQSLYLKDVERVLPSLVTEVVERLNEQRLTQLPYLFKDVLIPDYTPDTRWTSVLGKYTRVAADVVALDAELPLKSRDSLERTIGEIPKLAMLRFMSESEIKKINVMIAQNAAEGMVANRIFQDVPVVIEAVWERLEAMFLQGLSTGVALVDSDVNTGTGIRVDYGFYDENKFTVDTLWSDTDAQALDDIQKIFDKALEDSNVITDVYADDVWLKAFYRNKQARESFAFANGVTVVSNGSVPVLNLDRASQVLMSEFQINLHRVQRRVKIEKDGEKTNTTPWAPGVAAFVCNDTLGSLVWTDCVEATHPAPQARYQTADDYILVSRYSELNPLREFTASQAMVVPVLNNVDQIYLLDTQTVSA